ncbi:MAG: hybrid sensor histidine kinase/response regulator, partial [Cyanobacteria bacterium J06560_2]
MSNNIEVLLIEDSFSDAKIIETIVSSSNLERPKLHHVERFQEGLVMLQSNSYDLVLLDLHLPDGELRH